MPAFVVSNTPRNIPTSVENIQWFHAYKHWNTPYSTSCDATTLPFTSWDERKAYLHVMCTWYDTYCRKKRKHSTGERGRKRQAILQQSEPFRRQRWENALHITSNPFFAWPCSGLTCRGLIEQQCLLPELFRYLCLQPFLLNSSSPSHKRC